jgi:hypothetical protein
MSRYSSAATALAAPPGIAPRPYRGRNRPSEIA